MAIDPAKLREEALRMPVEARARLAAELLGSLDHDDDGEVEELEHATAWGTEIAERLRQIDAGEVQAVPWNEARQRIVREE